MSKREKIKKVETDSKDTEEIIPVNEENETISKRKEAIMVEEDLEKEMKERIKKREEKEKLLYEKNRIRRFLQVHKNEIRLMLYAFFLFILLMGGIISAFFLYAFLGVSSPELLIIICSSVTIIGAILLIYIGRKYLLK